MEWELKGMDKGEGRGCRWKRIVGSGISATGYHFPSAYSSTGYILSYNIASLKDSQY